MHIDTSDIIQYSRGLDHVDSGLADMDIGHIDSNDLARRRVELQEIDKQFGGGGMQPRSREDIKIAAPNGQDIGAVGEPRLREYSNSDIGR